MTLPAPFPNKDTAVCISIASRPSNFGCTLHNAGYQALNLNYIYKSFGIDNQAALIAGVRAMGIRGCSVSMPFKQSILQELDELDDTAKVIGAVNTIVNDDGILTGYNTDAYGAEIVLKKNINFHSDQSVLLLGAGGAARAVIYALNKLGGAKTTLCNRHAQRLQELDSEQKFSRIAWEGRNDFRADLLINATSIGMTPDHKKMPIKEDSISNFSSFFDIVVTPHKTRLLSIALTLNKKVVYGYEMSFHQAVKQFELYTGHVAPTDVLRKEMFSLLGVNQ